MARTIRGCSTAWSQQKGASESKNNPSVLKLQEQADAKKGKVVVDYKLNIDYKPEGPDSNRGFSHGPREPEASFLPTPS